MGFFHSALESFRPLVHFLKGIERSGANLILNEEGRYYRRLADGTLEEVGVFALPAHTHPYTEISDSSVVLDAVQAVSALGTASQLLRMNAGATGLEFAGTTTPTFYGCRAYLGAANQSIPTDTYTNILWDQETFDSGGYHSTSTNPSRFTIPAGKAGKYLVTARAILAGVTSLCIVGLRKNGAQITRQDYYLNAAAAQSLVLSEIVDCAVGDYIEIDVYQGSGGAQTLYGHSAGAYSSVEISLIESAGVQPAVSSVEATTFLGARAVSSSSQSVPNATQTKVILGSEQFDADGSFDSSRYTVATPGKYLIIGQVHWEAVAGGRRNAQIFKNGVTSTIQHQDPLGDGASGQNTITSGVLDLIAGDYIELYAYQTSGSAVSISSGYCHLQVVFLGASSPLQVFTGAKLTKAANQSLTSAVETAITWTSESFDSDGFHDNSTNPSRFTVPAGRAGKYQFWARLMFSANGTGTRYAFFKKNGVDQSTSLTFSTPNSTYLTTVETQIVLELVAGDYVEVFARQDSGGALDTLATYAEFTGVYLGGGATITPTALCAIYKTAAGQSIPHGATTIVDFGTVELDTHTRVTTGAAWKFTADRAGVYSVDARITMALTTTWGGSEELDLAVYKNGVLVAWLGFDAHPTSGVNFNQSVGGSRKVYCAAGDYLDFRVFQSSGAALSVYANANYNYCSIAYLGA